MRIPRIIFFPVLLLLFQKGFAQAPEGSNDIFFESNYQFGRMLPHHEYLVKLVKDPVQSFQFSVGKTVSGDQLWHQVFNFPSFGVGYFQSSLSNNQVFGSFHAAYIFVDRYYLDVNNRFNFGNRFDVGLAYADHIYSSISNPENMAIGTHLNACGRFCLEASYRLTPHIKILAGVGLIHISNGSFKKPNSGLNLATASVSIQYHLNKEPHRVRKMIVDPDSTKNEFIIYTGYGMKNISIDNSQQFSIYSLNLAYNRKLFISRYVGLNLYLSYYPSIAEEVNYYFPEVNVKPIDKLRIAVNASYEMRLGNLSFAFQPGIYLKNKLKPDHNICNRLGLRYYSKCGLVTALTVNAYWTAKADVLEWGIGYRFKS
jgi:hypothetical protein